MNIQEPLTDKFGFKYYMELPPSARVATENDFTPVNEAVKKQKPYLIHGFHYNKYECHRCKPGFLIDKIKPWLDAGRVYIFEEIIKQPIGPLTFHL